MPIVSVINESQKVKQILKTKKWYLLYLLTKVKK